MRACLLYLSSSVLPAEVYRQQYTIRISRGHVLRDVPTAFYDSRDAEVAIFLAVDGRSATFRLTPAAGNLLRSGEALAFEWHRQAPCCAGRGRLARVSIEKEEAIAQT
jgi:hypothetical protein